MHYMGEELEGEKRREEAERKGGKRGRICTVEPLYSGHYWNQHFVPKRGVPNSGAFGIFTVGVLYCTIGMLSTTWLHFQSFPLLYAGREGYAKASTTINSANLMSSCYLQQRWWTILLKRSMSVC